MSKDFTKRKKGWKPKRWGYFKVPDFIFELGLSVHAIVIITYLCRRADQDGLSYPSLAKICHDCGIKSHHTVEKAIKELEDEYLVIKESGGIGRSNLYRLTPHVLKEVRKSQAKEQKPATNHAQKPNVQLTEQSGPFTIGKPLMERNSHTMRGKRATVKLYPNVITRDILIENHNVQENEHSENGPMVQNTPRHHVPTTMAPNADKPRYDVPTKEDSLKENTGKENTYSKTKNSIVNANRIDSPLPEKRQGDIDGEQNFSLRGKDKSELNQEPPAGIVVSQGDISGNQDQSRVVNVRPAEHSGDDVYVDPARAREILNHLGWYKNRGNVKPGRINQTTDPHREWENLKKHEPPPEQKAEADLWLEERRKKNAERRGEIVH